MTRPNITEKEGRRHNIGFAKWRVQRFYDSLVQGSTFGILMNICGKNPPLRKAAIRCTQLKQNELHRTNTTCKFFHLPTLWNMI
jgi:hypothetical protein